MSKLVIATDFSPITGGRTPQEGDFSGELFRDTILLSAYNEALAKKEILEIDFDGCYGIGTSFLEEAFGGLVRVHKCIGVLDNIILVANDDETIPSNVIKYVRDAEDKLKHGKR